jgi:hypothetical protein
MSKLLLFFFFLINFNTFITYAKSSTYKWQNLTPAQKVAILVEVKQFVQLYQKDMELGDDIKSTNFFLYLINQAHADTNTASDLNCLYGGWPSKKVTYGERVVCANPKTKNPNYANIALAKCSSTQLLCNPVLFGEDICVPGATSSERSSSFSNCQIQFNSKGRTLEDVVAKIDANPALQKQLEQILLVANKTCGSNGYQSRSGMCKTFMLKMAEIKKLQLNSNAPSSKIEDSNTITISDVTAIQTEIKKSENIISQINSPKNNRPCYESISIPDAETIKEIWEQSHPIDQKINTRKDHCSGNQNGSGKSKYFQTKHANYDLGASLNVSFIQDLDVERDLKVDGFEISAEKYGKDSIYIEDGTAYSDMIMNPKRDFSYEGVDHKDAMFSVVDSPIKEKYGANGKVIDRYSSTDIKITNYMFFPRRVTPTVKIRDDKMYMTLITGEKVVFDAKTGKVLDGAFIETPDNKTETRTKEKRFYPDSNFTYRGEGIWLEAPVTYNTDYRRAGSIIPIKSLIDGKSYQCDVKSEDLFETNWGYYMPQENEGWLNSGWSCFRFKFETDQAFYAFIKEKCPNFKMPYLAK